MALTLDQIVSGALPGPVEYMKAAFTGQAAGELHSSFLLVGTPGAGSSPGGGINGSARANPYTGTVAVPAAVASRKSYLTRFEFERGSNVGGGQVCDRIWDNTFTVTSTSSQAIAAPTLGSRDATFTAGQAAPSNNGVGWLCGLEVYATMGAATPTVTLTYTAADGTAGRTAAVTGQSGAVAGWFQPFPLQAGDLGVRTPTAVQLSVSWVSGTAGLVLYRPIARIGAPVTSVSTDRNALDLGLPLLPDGGCLWLVYRLTGASAGQTSASLTFSQA